ncbi:MAG TPA: hypothetical protein ENF86_00090 [Firmicutes bacterium]|nr:hypothetical protein [Bacillota bacterium]
MNIRHPAQYLSLLTGLSGMAQAVGRSELRCARRSLSSRRGKQPIRRGYLLSLYIMKTAATIIGHEILGYAPLIVLPR